MSFGSLRLRWSPQIVESILALLRGDGANEEDDDVFKVF